MVESSEAAIRSIELQLVRVETCGEGLSVPRTCLRTGRWGGQGALENLGERTGEGGA